MDHAEVFTQVLDLEFPLGSAVEVELKLQLFMFVCDVAIPRFWTLSTLSANSKLAVYRFLE